MKKPFPASRASSEKTSNFQPVGGQAEVLNQDGQIHEEITGIVHIFHPLNTKDVLKTRWHGPKESHDQLRMPAGVKPELTSKTNSF